MVTKQGGTELLNDPVAQTLLASNNLARLAYSWTDGSPRVVPIWFHWNGQEVVFAGPTDHPKMTALRKDPRVAITIDDSSTWPYKALLLRGRAELDEVPGVAHEYASSARRYFGPDQGKAWVDTVGGLVYSMARMRVRPEWVGILDFEGRWPNAMERAMAAAGPAGN
ncbi:MAG: pyridoxamine 5'-phosphate oxidase family protein [Chloroflexi bacterium]|nr:pyridoxamine 5'-phosphate oxidase family protein [Chloroflexota bacterium]